MSRALDESDEARIDPTREHDLLPNRRLALEDTLGLLVATALLFFLFSVESARPAIQSIDDDFLRLMGEVRSSFLTVVGNVFNIAGSAWVTAPVRVAVIVYLIVRRRWWHCAAFILAIVASEVAVTVLKPLYGRPRPPDPLVITSGSSFPSGHAVATSTTAVALVLALLPRGSHRLVWAIAAALFALLMALSRAYLNAHWLSDVIAGTLLGTTIAMGSALYVQSVRDARRRHRVMMLARDPP